MVDPSDVTDFDRSKEELQEFLLFSVCAAGKRADIQARKLDKFLMGKLESPFYFIRKLDRRGCLEDRMRRVKLGKYSTLVPCFSSLAEDDPNLEEISRKGLEDYHGIGPKTSRFFLLHSREDFQVASLDTHVLKWMDEVTDDNVNIPNKTPEENKYSELQDLFLKKCEEYDLSPAEMDLKIWNYYSGNTDQLDLN